MNEEKNLMLKMIIFIDKIYRRKIFLQFNRIHQNIIEKFIDIPVGRMSTYLVALFKSLLWINN